MEQSESTTKSGASAVEGSAVSSSEGPGHKCESSAHSSAIASEPPAERLGADYWGSERNLDRVNWQTPYAPPAFGREGVDCLWTEESTSVLESRVGGETLAVGNRIEALLHSSCEPVAAQSTLGAIQDLVLTQVYSSADSRRRLDRPRYGGPQAVGRRSEVRCFDLSWYCSMPGPQPATISRSELSALADQFYYVTEKSDGLRVMLLISTLPSALGCFLFDRRFKAWRIRDDRYAQIVERSTANALFDCELILAANGLMLLLFDCMAHSGVSVVGEDSDHRFQALHTFVRMAAHCLDSATTPLPIVIGAKRHVALENGDSVAQVLDCISDEVYVDPNGFYQAKSDGLIFTPKENSYLMDGSSVNPLLKWKPLTMNTIDLKVKTPFFFRGKLQLFTEFKHRNQTNDVLFAQSQLDAAQRRAFDALRKAVADRDQFVVECQLDTDTLRWLPTHLRADKHKPNYATICAANVEVMLNAITETDLVKVAESIRDIQ